MADVLLGPTIATAVLLPPTRWMGGSPPTLPIAWPKALEKAVMLSGRVRYNFKSEDQRRWQFSWEALNAIELDQLRTLRAQNKELWLLSGWDDVGWCLVVISDFNYAPNVRTNICGGDPVLYGDPFYGDPYYGAGIDALPLYSVDMVLEEVRN